MAPSNLDKTSSEMAELVSTLAQAAAGERDWRKLARSLATTLRGSRLDWRHLARALDQARTTVFPTDAGRAAQFLDRVAILAMQLNKRDPPKVSAEILDACARDTEPEPILRKMLSIVQDHIPFDVCSYNEYSHGSGEPNDPTFMQSRFALDGSEQFRWPARWIKIPGELVAWTEGRKRYIPDIADFYEEHPEAEALKSDVVSQEYERRGITSFLVAPRMDGGRVMAAMTFGRRRDGQYPPFNKYDQDRLDALRLELVLRRVGEAFERRTGQLVQEIIELFTPIADVSELAFRVVRKLGEGYGLEYVGLFRVNRALRLFEVVAEHDRHGELQVPANYSQELDKGMLSHVLRERRELYAANVRVKPPPYDYLSTRDAQASAMCLPIRLGRDLDSEIEWILDLESSQFDAFPRPEQIALKRIVAEVERSLQLWFEARLCAALLDLVEQGVVVLGEQTRIERANAAARKLLGLPRDSKLPFSDAFADLEAFAADTATRELIRDGQSSSAGPQLRLRGPDGIERRAIAGSSYHDEAFHRRVWLLGDVEQAEWVDAVRHMEAAVRTVSGQAHGSLRLASALLRRVQSTLGASSPEYSLVDRAIRSITTADLPYERIACAYDMITTQLHQYSVLNLWAMLLLFQSSLPPDDARVVKLNIPDDPIIVKSDPKRLSFALRSLLGYLLTLRLPGAQLEVSLYTSQIEATVEIKLTGAPNDVVARLDRTPEHNSTTDKIADADALAVAAAAHGLEAIQAVIKAHDGELRQSFVQDREVRFTIRGLRLAPPGLNREGMSYDKIRSDRRIE
jgi:PAS domain-containing protein